MLKSLYISNYALISELQIDFNAGFSVLTGETGAGKSIILGALSLILGNRADTKSIKSDSDKCIIEAEFDLTTVKHISDFFLNNDLDKPNENCIIRRELTINGKSRAFINDTPVSLLVLRNLTSQLIDIHSQHDNLLLSNEGFQLDVVDIIAQNQVALQKYSHRYTEWQSLNSELKNLETKARRQSNELDFIQFQFKQLTEANLIDGEQEELEQELETLSHAEEIKSELLTASHLFDNERATLTLLKEISASIQKIKSFISEGENLNFRIQSAYIELKDLHSEISTLAENIEYNSERLEYIENRLSEIYLLEKKFKVDTVVDLIGMRNEFDAQLQKIDSYDGEIEELKQKIASTQNLLSIDADELSKTRSEIANSIESAMVQQLIKLGMPNIQFKVQINMISTFTEKGIDEIQFLFSANKNREMQAVQLIASGGEISRLMLSLKYLIADKSNLPTIIFDEIDTGVSGEIAHRMAEIMKNMGTNLQVITISHLPQIAAKSSHHYLVYKDDSGAQTQTRIKLLDEEARIRELAQMLSAKKLTEASILNARELLNSN